MCQVTHLKYWRFKLRLQLCMFCLFLETQVWLLLFVRLLCFFSYIFVLLCLLLCWVTAGVILFYKDFVEFLYELLGGTASVTAIGHVSHTRKNWEHGRLFSLQEQIDHKIDFIREQLQNIEIPILLVGHSIGAYISIETFKKSAEKVKFCVALYPFLTLNLYSTQQLVIGKIAKSQMLAAAISYLIASLGLLPVQALRFIVKNSIGKSWSASAVEAACSHLSQCHTMRNVLYMAMTEFKKLSETPDWTFIRERKAQFAFLFGVDDHWGPFQLLDEISKQVPGVAISIERENHTHGFCCSEAGSLWVAQHVANLIKNQMACTNQ
ncbi:lipid droplet-associated hydrolase isoform X2 [Abrus precatorius]|uniref:Lipid droplet-associated hydrolase isoform X2 n=1 Tax=Abrus precatorius TaxID=3816 RepID=A0A8B8L2L7_ABRPR|nr:lipid droplet-associated hydrolase isoform X2 [Abrus precatorius]XP_027350437.1 lipid droplet-associated hydrolase isoform X2 [Abrus precatorius]